MLRCAITPGELAREGDSVRRRQSVERLVERCEELARDGVDFLLVREKELAAGELTKLVRRVIDRTRETGARVLVAQRVDVSLAAGAHGVHLSSRGGELSAKQVKQVMAAVFVSVSCHTLDEVRRRVAEGADAILFAPVFGKWIETSKVSAGVGVEALAEAVEAAGGVPVLALGGVTATNARACLDAGAAGVAGIRLFFA